MNPYDDHEFLFWAMKAGLTREEARRAVREGLDSWADSQAERQRDGQNRSTASGQVFSI
jgi:hypothetical protein